MTKSVPTYDEAAAISRCDHALEAARRGFKVFPVVANGKVPAIKGWQQFATRDESVIRGWFDGPNPPNIGIATADFLVLDLDKKKGGLETFKALSDQQNLIGEPFPKTLHTMTWSGGAHSFYKPREGVKVKGGVDVLGPGIDVRATGGLVVAAGSTINDMPYVWGNDRDVAEAPQWLVDMVQERAGQHKKAANAGKRLADECDESVADAERYIQERAPEAVEGQGGDNTAFQVAAKLFDFGVSKDTALHLLHEWNQTKAFPPFELHDLERHVDSASRNRQNPIGIQARNNASGFQPMTDEEIAASERMWERVEQMKADANATAAGFEAAVIDESKAPQPEGVQLENFRAYMLMAGQFIYAPTGEMWPASSVSARVPPQLKTDVNGNPILDEKKKEQYIPASAWLQKHRPVEQMTWAPGLPQIIQNRLISDGGWIERKGVSCFNLYRPATIKLGDASKAGPWLDHLRKVYATAAEADHIIKWLAQRVQHPEVKLNHALVLGGQQGIGKDSILEPVKSAVGPWNFSEVSPVQVIGRFTSFLRSVILRVSEARDLGEVNRYALYEHMKAFIASPPDVLRIDEKHTKEYSILNLLGVIFTTNNKTTGLYLPEDDRRHYVAWSDLDKGRDFDDEYWLKLWGWYEAGGRGHAAAYLHGVDLSNFDPKAPPPKTDAWWAIVDANRAPEESELADLLDALGNPDAVTVDKLTGSNFDMGAGIRMWLADRKNRRGIPHRLESCGYVPVRNPSRDTGLWVVGGKRQVVYAKTLLSVRDRIAAAGRL
jgi:hypothetical protein